MPLHVQISFDGEPDEFYKLYVPFTRAGECYELEAEGLLRLFRGIPDAHKRIIRQLKERPRFNLKTLSDEERWVVDYYRDVIREAQRRFAEMKIKVTVPERRERPSDLEPAADCLVAQPFLSAPGVYDAEEGGWQRR